ncbi:MAG: peptidase C15 [Elainellaceae cyanobacterium]
MFQDILLTSFQVWRADQPSNASDDLLQIVGATYPQLSTLRFLRRLPVHFEQAPQQVIEAIEAYKPAAVVCCGMGEPRHKLGLESTAVGETRAIHSPLPLPALQKGLSTTEISHDAGRFVCNRLYYDVLSHLQNHSGTFGLFIHVPRLTPQNCSAIAADFTQVLDRLNDLLFNLRPNHPVAIPRPYPPSQPLLKRAS